jgi:transposase InsO family protein
VGEPRWLGRHHRRQGGPKGTHLKFPKARPRVISDRGPQFIAKDFKEFIRLATEVDLHQWLAARSWRPRSKLKNETPSAL